MRASVVSDSLSSTPVPFAFSPLVNGPYPSNLVPHFLSFSLFPHFFFLSEKRFNKQYSKEYKAKEVSEGEESKDFWNVLGGKANFTSLSAGLYCCTILCILRASYPGFPRFRKRSGKKIFFKGNYIFIREKSVKSRGILKTDVCGNHVIATPFCL